MGMFLQSLASQNIGNDLFTNSPSSLRTVNPITSSPISIIILICVILIFIGIYIYTSLAFRRIGAKAGLQNPNVSWFPFGLMTFFEASGMSYWPWPFFIIGLLVSYSIVTISINLVNSIFFFIGGILIYIVFLVFLINLIIWQWKTFEKIKSKGSYSLITPILIIISWAINYLSILLSNQFLLFISGVLLFVSIIVYLVLIGILAWRK